MEFVLAIKLNIGGGGGGGEGGRAPPQFLHLCISCISCSMCAEYVYTSLV